MEHLAVTFDDATFDELVHGADFAELADLKFVVKEDATIGGRPAVVIAFTVTPDNGKTLKKVQAVTTLANLRGALAAINARYPEE